MSNFIQYITKTNQDYTNFLSQNLGWTPAGKNNKFPKASLGKCGAKITEYLYNKNPKLNLIKKLIEFKKLADKHKAKLIIIFNPVSCTISNEVYPVIAEIEKLKKHNPDILIPFGVINTYDQKYFMDINHLNIRGAEKHSATIGKELSKILLKK